MSRRHYLMRQQTAGHVGFLGFTAPLAPAAAALCRSAREANRWGGVADSFMLASCCSASAWAAGGCTSGGPPAPLRPVLRVLPRKPAVRPRPDRLWYTRSPARWRRTSTSRACCIPSSNRSGIPNPPSARIGTGEESNPLLLPDRRSGGLGLTRIEARERFS